MVVWRECILGHHFTLSVSLPRVVSNWNDSERDGASRYDSSVALISNKINGYEHCFFLLFLQTLNVIGWYLTILCFVLHMAILTHDVDRTTTAWRVSLRVCLFWVVARGSFVCYGRCGAACHSHIQAVKCPRTMFLLVHLGRQIEKRGSQLHHGASYKISQDSVYSCVYLDETITVVFRLQAGRNRIWFLAGLRCFYILQNFQSDSGAHPASYPIDIGAFSFRVKLPVREETAHFFQVPRLKMSGAAPPICLHYADRDGYTFI